MTTTTRWLFVACYLEVLTDHYHARAVDEVVFFPRSRPSETTSIPYPR